MRLPQDSKLIFQVANEDRNESLHRIRLQRVRSTEFANRGWVYLRLKPGICLLQVRDARFDRSSEWPQKYRLYVSPRGTMFYGGTFKMIGKYDSEFDSELEEARRLAEAEFKDSGSLKVALPHPPESFASAKPIQELAPVAVQTAGTRTLVPPNWTRQTVRERVKNTALTQAGGGSVGADPITGAVLAAELIWNVTVVPAIGVAGWVEGKRSQKQWAPCIRELKEEFARRDLAAELRDALAKGLREKGQSLPGDSTNGTDAASLASERNCPSLVYGDIRRVQLIQGDKRKKIRVQMVVRFRLWDQRSDDCLYDKTLQVASHFREIKDYSAKPGRARFGDDLSKAIQSGVERFLADLSPASPTTDKPEFANKP